MKIGLRDIIKQISPPWLTVGNGERFMYNFGLMSDALLEKMNQSMLARFPGIGDSSADPYLAADRVLTQGPAEPSGPFEARLSQAFDAWARAGNAKAILGQIAAYLQEVGANFVAQKPVAALVTGTPTTNWDVVYTTTPIGGQPVHVPRILNWDWDGIYLWYRSWLVLYFSQVPTGQTGSSASIVSGAGVSQFGSNVNGVWTATNATLSGGPFMTITGLVGITSANLHQYLTISGAASSGNNASCLITSVLSSSSVIVANPSGVAADANNGSLAWSIGYYPVVGPAPVYDAPGFSYGDASWCWGASVPSGFIAGIRNLLLQWKRAEVWISNIILSFDDGGFGGTGSAYSPYSTIDAGNPDSSWYSWGKLVNGVWVNARTISNTTDDVCDGTGLYQGTSTLVNATG